MALSPLAGKPAPKEMLIDPEQLVREYYVRKPDPAEPAQQISFGTSDTGGSPLTGSFNERTSWRSRRRFATTGAAWHQRAALHGPRSHAVSSPAQRTALEVLAANGVRRLFRAETA